MKRHLILLGLATALMFGMAAESEAHRNTVRFSYRPGGAVRFNYGGPAYRGGWHGPAVRPHVHYHHGHGHFHYHGPYNYGYRPYVYHYHW